VPDPGAFYPDFKAALDFALEQNIHPTLKESEDILAVEVTNRVIQQRRIDGLQVHFIFKEDVGGVLAFADGPVVRLEMKGIPRSHPGVGDSSHVFQEWQPVAINQAVHEPLCFLHIIDFEKAIVTFSIADSCTVEAMGQPFPAVKADLDSQREPSLQSDMHEAEFAVQEIEVQVQALPISRL
jgi:hypothetical protein